MRTVTVVFAALLMIAMPASVATGEEEPGVLAQVTFWTANDAAAFETGLKAHNDLHKEQGDPVALLTWQVVSGERAGQYLRASFGHHWSDFDVDEDIAAADAADSAVHLTPYIAAAEPATYRFIPELSSTPAGPKALSRIIVFELEPGQAVAFENTISKIRDAVMKVEDWPPGYWYALVDGGRMPTYVLSSPRDSWADFAPGEKTLGQAVADEYGDGAAAIWEALFDTIERQYNYTTTYRPDLSYVPVSE